MPKDKRTPGPDPLEILSLGEVTIEGRMPWSSNGTYLASVYHRGTKVMAIYKPERAERPLWDFPSGLYRREVAAFELSRALGWRLVPPTALAERAPLGPGSLQLFIDADFEQHYFTLLEDPSHHPQLKAMAIFDILANNADRKSGHCLLDVEGAIWAIDHGLCFHRQPKLRTVIWDFAGEAIDARTSAAIEPLASGEVPEGLARLLAPGETQALIRRAAALLEQGRLPEPTGDYPFPWPLI